MKTLKYTFFTILMTLFISFQAKAAEKPGLVWKNFFYKTPRIETIAYNPLNKKLYAIGEVEKTYSISYSQRGIFISSDSGKTWKSRNKTAKVYLIKDLKIDSIGNLYCISHGDDLIRSTDDGYTFDTLFKSNNDRLDLKFNSKGGVFLISDHDENRIYYSSNTGETWDTTKLDFDIKQLYVDSKDNTFLISSPVKEFNNDGFILTLKSAYNDLYFFNQETKQTNKILSTSSFNSSTNVFIDITDDDNFLYILTAKEYYYYADMRNDHSYYEPFILKINKNDYSYSKIELPFLKVIISKNIVGNIEMNNNKNLLLQWSDSLFLSDVSLTQWNVVYDYFDSYESSELIVDKNSNFVFFKPHYELYDFYVSANDGKTWIKCKPVYENHYPLKTVYMTRDSTFICTDTNDKIFKTKNEGFLWEELTSNLPTKQNINCIAQTKQGNIVIGTEKSGLYYLNDDGTWINKNTTIGNRPVRLLSEGDEGEIYVCTDTAVYMSNDECLTYKLLTYTSAKEFLYTPNGLLIVTKDGKLLTSDAQGKNFREITNSWTENKVTSIAMNKLNIIIAATRMGGVYKSTDFGNSWQPSNTELWSPEVYQIAAGKDDMFIALTETGIFITDNGGDIWAKTYYPNGYYNNLDNSYKLTSTRDGKVFIFYAKESKYTDSISFLPIEIQSGWISHNNYLEEKLRTIYFWRKKFSNDSKHLFTYFDSLFYKWSTESGDLLYERHLPFIDSYSRSNCVDVNDAGTLALIIQNQNSQKSPKGVKITIFNLKTGEIVNQFDPASHLPYLCKNAYAVFDEKKSRIISFINCIDTTKNINDTCSYGEIQFRDLNGNLINSVISGYTGSLYIFSKDFSWVYYKELKWVVTGKGEYSYINSSYSNLYNINKNQFFIIDSLYDFDYYSTKFSPDNKYLLMERDSIFYICDLTKLDTSKYNQLNKIEIYNKPFTFIDSINIIASKYEQGKGSKLLLYNIMDMKLVGVSEDYYPIYKNDIIELSPSGKDLAINNDRILYYIKDVLNKITTNIPSENYKPVLSPKIFPNPSEDKAILEFNLKEAAYVKILLSDESGKIINKYNIGYRNSGNNTYELDQTGLLSGVYFCIIVTNNNIETVKYVVNK